jgi:hypothetical protein
MFCANYEHIYIQVLSLPRLPDFQYLVPVSHRRFIITVHDLAVKSLRLCLLQGEKNLMIFHWGKLLL